MHSCKRTMCRVPRCRAETSKHVTYSCDCCKTKSSLLDKKMSLCATPATQSAKRRPGTTMRRPSVPPRACSATPATQNKGRCRQVPRLPRETKVDVALCHACHAKCRGAPGKTNVRPSVPPATQNEGRCHQVPRLPRETKVDVTLCHACHAKCRRQPSAPPEPGDLSATPATQNARFCLQVPRLPRKTKVDVAKCHACHVKRRWMSPSATPATQSAAAPRRPTRDQARHQPSATSATPATQNAGRCRQVPRLPRETKVDVTKCHACRQVPRLPRETKVDVTKCHTCHAKKTRATNGDQSASHQARPVPQVPRLPRKTKVDVAKCHACHVKRRWVSPSATPATQSAAAPEATNADQA